MTELSNQEKIELMKIALQTSHEEQGVTGIVVKNTETLVKDYFTLLEAIYPNSSGLPQNHKPKCCSDFDNSHTLVALSKISQAAINSTKQDSFE